jgi:hypothetical protein
MKRKLIHRFGRGGIGHTRLTHETSSLWAGTAVEGGNCSCTSPKIVGSQHNTSGAKPIEIEWDARKASHGIRLRSTIVFPLNQLEPPQSKTGLVRNISTHGRCLPVAHAKKDRQRCGGAWARAHVADRHTASRLSQIAGRCKLSAT